MRLVGILVLWLLLWLWLLPLPAAAQGIGIVQGPGSPHGITIPPGAYGLTAGSTVFFGITYRGFGTSTPAPIGSIVPNTYRGHPIFDLYQADVVNRVLFQINDGCVTPQNDFTSITINGVTLLSANVLAYGTTGSCRTYWLWQPVTPLPLPSNGDYVVSFVWPDIGPYDLTAGIYQVGDPVVTYLGYDPSIPIPDGAISPGTYRGYSIVGVEQEDGSDSFLFAIQTNGGAMLQSDFTTLTINGVPFTSASATFYQDATYTIWEWNGTLPLPGVGAYNVTITP